MDEAASSSDIADWDPDDWDSDEHEPVPEPTGLLPESRGEYLDGRLWSHHNRSALDRRGIFELPAGEERTRRLKEIVEEFPRFGAALYQNVVDVGRADLVRLLIELEASAIGPDPKPNHRTSAFHPLHRAAVKGDLECVQLLVEQAGVRINEVDRFHGTALMTAAICGHVDIVKWLLSKGASVTIKAVHFNNIISMAMRSGEMEIVKAILEHEETKNSGLVCSLKNLPQAALGGNVEILDLVLSADCLPPPTGDLKSMTDDQKFIVLAAIDFSIGQSSIACLKRLLPYVTRQRPDGWYDYFQAEDRFNFDGRIHNAINHAIQEADDPDLFQIAWESIICDPGSGDSDTISLSPSQLLHQSLTEATRHGRLETVKRIHERYDVDVNYVVPYYYCTPFGGAVDNGNWYYPEERLAVAKYLLQHADVDIHVGRGVITNGESYLAAAVYEQYEGMVRLLLRHGGPVESIDKTIYRHAENAEVGEKVSVALVVDHSLENKPLRILTPKALDLLVEQKEEQEWMTLEWEREELIAILESLQIRKTAEQLLMSDPTREVKRFRKRR